MSKSCDRQQLRLATQAYISFGWFSASFNAVRKYHGSPKDLLRALGRAVTRRSPGFRPCACSAQDAAVLSYRWRIRGRDENIKDYRTWLKARGLPSVAAGRRGCSRGGAAETGSTHAVTAPPPPA